MKYIKKPVVVEAFKLGYDDIPNWFIEEMNKNKIYLSDEPTEADIETLEGWHHASYGDYIIRGVKGEIYPCKPDIFVLTYDEADKGMR